MKRYLALATAVLLAGCSLDKQAQPALAGPSELALSLAITATPDIITQDGRSQSTIQVFARDAMSQPISGLTLRAETVVGGRVQDFGLLSQKTLSTGADGKVTITYQSPSAPPPTVTDDSTVAVQFTPVGTNYANTNDLVSAPRNVQIRLVRPGIILPPSTQPIPDFFFSPTTPNENDVVSFDASTSMPGDTDRLVAFDWSFGDGATASGLRVTHTFGLRGSYPVSLTVTDNLGVQVRVQHIVAVGGTAIPSAAFTISPTQPIVNQVVNFNGSGSAAAPGRSLVQYEWDFGDGSAHAGGVTSQHAYAIPGNYTVVLRAVDDTGHAGVASNTVTVTSAKPTADFTVSPPSPPVGANVQFNGTISSAPAGKAIVSYQWDFGDGGHGVGATTSHVYATVDTFTVVLTVTDDSGAVGITSKTLTTK